MAQTTKGGVLYAASAARASHLVVPPPGAAASGGGWHRGGPPSLEEEAKANTKPLTWKSMLLLIGVSFFISAISKDVGSMVANALPVFDSATWTVLLVTAVGLLVAMTPFGKELQEEVVNSFTMLEEEAFRNIPEEKKEELIDLLLTIHNNLITERKANDID